MEPVYKVGERVNALGFPGVVREVHIQMLLGSFLYTISCGICKEEHQVWENNLRKIEVNDAARG